MTYTLAEACERLGWGRSEEAQDRLRKRLERAEKKDKRPRLISSIGRGSPCKVAWHHVSEVAHCSAVDRISGPEWDDAMTELNCLIAAIADQRIDIRVMPEVGRLDEKIEKTAEAVNDLRECLRRLS